MQKRDYSNKEITRRLFREYLSKHRTRIILAVLCMVVSAVAGAAQAYMLKPILDEVFLDKNIELLYVLPLIFLFIAVLGGAANYFQTIYMRFVGQRIVADMQIQLFNHALDADLARFHDESSGKLISRFTNDIQMMRQALSSVLTGLARETLALIAYVGVMLYQSWELTLIALVVFPAAIYPIIRLGKNMRKVADGTQQELGRFTATLDETFKNVREVKAYNKEAAETQKASASINRLFNLYMRASRVQAASSPLMEIVAGLGVAAVIWYGGYQIIQGHNTPGEFFSFMTAMLMAYKPLRSVSGLNTQLQEGLAAAERFFEIIDIAPTITNNKNAHTLDATHPDICFDKVSFAYDKEVTALHDVSFTVPAHQMVALVGASGSGKSTIMSVLLRFFDATSGMITINGQNIRNVSLESLRNNMALVSQDVMLFDDTVMANIAYGNADATQDEIIYASQQAAAHDFIMALPQGYDTPIGPAGVKLSGGQRQRLSIARAILKNAPILLLDEATSALDTQSEQQVQQALSNLSKSRTSLVIAHRLSTIHHADCIYVLDKGKIVEYGTHETLISQEGVYANLYRRQFHQSHMAQSLGAA
jgi:ATP-binding cassette, subfamily B, bacterial MsbA